ncbi:MAG: 16S rRNA (cytidine(1402)-2'-O)-methyltransferase [Acidimicrobiia bacterium]|nr:16S rRNA (cytidine(1402)-2'-O)-methyltransferase [Acidimicrobiia bacterium]
MATAGASGARRAALVVVATPIGNLGDLSDRARTELAGADLLACEDTRRSGRLLASQGIRPARLLRVDEHTERHRTAEVLDVVRSGGRVVLISDAGTPAVSDPGRVLVDAAHDAGLRVVVVPGPSAAIAALVLSGFATERFVFEGFLPRKGARRRLVLVALADEPRTSVLYESPKRVVATLEDLRRHCGDERRVAICREMTKLHEEVWRGPLGEALGSVDKAPARGEHVLVLEGAPPPAAPDDEAIRRALAVARTSGASTRDCVELVRAQLGVGRREVYRVALEDEASADRETSGSEERGDARVEGPRPHRS